MSKNLLGSCGFSMNSPNCRIRKLAVSWCHNTPCSCVPTMLCPFSTRIPALLDSAGPDLEATSERVARLSTQGSIPLLVGLFQPWVLHLEARCWTS
jgi:hypothetical protein